MSAEPSGAGGIPCQDCAGHNPVWFAPSPDWNFVIGGPDAKGDPGGMLCPNCYIRRAEAAGLRPTAWIVSQEALEPSGGLDLAKLEEVARAATKAGEPEGWQIDNFGKEGFPWGAHSDADSNHIIALSRTWDDINYIATFDPPTVLRLIDRIGELETALGEIESLEDILSAVEAALTAKDEPEDYNPTLLQRAQDVMSAYEHNRALALAKSAGRPVPPHGSGP